MATDGHGEHYTIRPVPVGDPGVDATNVVDVYSVEGSNAISVACWRQRSIAMERLLVLVYEQTPEDAVMIEAVSCACCHFSRMLGQSWVPLPERLRRAASREGK
jgi:hypothetical protein